MFDSNERQQCKVLFCVLLPFLCIERYLPFETWTNKARLKKSLSKFQLISIYRLDSGCNESGCGSTWGTRNLNILETFLWGEFSMKKRLIQRKVTGWSSGKLIFRTTLESSPPPKACSCVVVPASFRGEHAASRICMMSIQILTALCLSFFDPIPVESSKCIWVKCSLSPS